MSEPLPEYIVRNAATGKEARGHVAWATCVLGGRLIVSRTDKEGTFVSSSIIAICSDEKTGAITSVTTRHSTYHIEGCKP